MDKRQDESVQPAVGSGLDQHIRGIAGIVHGARFPRRYFVLGGLASAAALLASCGGNSSSGNPTPTVNLSAPAPTGAPQVQSGTPAATSASTTAATSAASPAAGGQTLGKLKLTTDPYPTYTGTPADSDLLTIIRSEDLSDLNPAALNSYSPYTFSYDPLVWIDEYKLDPNRGWEPAGKLPRTARRTPTNYATMLIGRTVRRSRPTMSPSR